MDNGSETPVAEKVEGVATPEDDAAAAARAREAGWVSVEEHDAVVAERDAAIARADAAEAENAKLTAALDSAKAKVTRRTASAKLRKIGPVKTPIAADDLQALLAGDVEIAFSDGRTEISGIEPLGVSGLASWSKLGARWVLRPPVTLHGPAIGDGPYEIRGFGLLDGEGRQVAWGPLHEPAIIAGGQECQFRDSIIF